MRRLFEWINNHPIYGGASCLWCVRATLHTRLKAYDHCIPRSLIGRKGRDSSSSLHTRRWRSTGQKKLSWVRSLQGLLHSKPKITFHDLLEFALHHAHLEEVGFKQIMADHVGGTHFGWESRALTSNVVMAFGLCVKWPLVGNIYWLQQILWI